MIQINGMEFIPLPDVTYAHDYVRISHDVASKKLPEINTYRTLAKQDLFFFVYFILKIPIANHPFIVQACKDVEEGQLDCTLDLWARDHFKAVDLKEPVLTTSGWRNHGDLVPGNFVYSPNGEPVEVVAKTEIFTNADCYRVLFSDGYSVVVSGDHLWEVGKKSRRRVTGTKNQRHRRDYSVLNTKDLFNHEHRPDNRLSVKLTEPLEMPSYQLRIDPYILGAWLGDGTSGCNSITIGDQDSLFFVNEFSKTEHVLVKTRAKYRYRISNFRPLLRECNLLGNKHIPEDYLRSSISHRLSLLQGLMDTDGTCDDRGTATFCNKNLNLINQVFELAISLGLSPNRRKVETTFNGKPYIFYQVSFQSYKNFPCFRLPRKLAKSKSGIGRRDKYIISVEKVDSIPVSCIQVASEDGLYLIGKQLTTTHNSTIITIARTIQVILKNPEERIAIFSYSREAARKFTRQIKTILEANEFLNWLFPDVLWADTKDSPKWTDEALAVRRTGFYKEQTVEAWGLIEGAPIGGHFTGRIYDDIETTDVVNTLELMRKLEEAFYVSENLGTAEGWHCVIGTHYHHEGILNKLRYKVDEEGNLIYKVRVKTATVDGTPNGESVFLPESKLKKLRMSKRHFFCQQLLDPTPQGEQELDFNLVKIIKKEELPQRLFRFMAVDPAGERQDKRKRDSWGMVVFGVDPVLSDTAASNIYILDMVIEEFSLEESLSELVSMYMRNGRIIRLGIEKVSMQSMEVHVVNALRNRNRHLSEDAGNLQLLRPAGRNKGERIVRALQWPLLNGAIHMLDTIPIPYRERLKWEMDKFPFGNTDDGIDALAYGVNDMIKDFPFSRYRSPEELKQKDAYELARLKQLRNKSKIRGWMAA